MNTNKPRISILSEQFKYTSAAGTNVEATWRKHGWLPEEERRKAKEAAERAERILQLPPKRINR